MMWIDSNMFCFFQNKLAYFKLHLVNLITHQIITFHDIRHLSLSHFDSPNSAKNVTLLT